MSLRRIFCPAHDLMGRELRSVFIAFLWKAFTMGNHHVNDISKTVLEKTMNQRRQLQLFMNGLNQYGCIPLADHAPLANSEDHCKW